MTETKACQLGRAVNGWVKPRPRAALFDEPVSAGGGAKESWHFTCALLRDRVRTSGNWIFQRRRPPENSAGVCQTAFQNLKCSPADYSLFRNSNTHVYHSRHVAVVHQKLREKIESGFVPQGLKSTTLRVVSLRPPSNGCRSRFTFLLSFFP